MSKVITEQETVRLTDKRELQNVKDWFPNKSLQFIYHKSVALRKFQRQIDEMLQSLPLHQDRVDDIMDILKHSKPWPIFVDTQDGFIIEGRHRVVAAHEAGLKTTPVIYVTATKTAKSDVFYKQVGTGELGTTISKTDAKKLIRELQSIVNLNNVDQAKQRWLNATQSGQNETRYSPNDQWELQDKRTMLQVAGLFRHHQRHLPIKFQTIHKRLNDFAGPINLFGKFGNAEKWLKNIRNTAKALIKALENFISAPQAKYEYQVGKCTLVNKVGFTEDEVRPYVDMLKEAVSHVPPKYAYGEVKLATRKEVKHGGRTAAYYSESDDSMSIITDSADPNPVRSICHEFAHRIHRQNPEAYEKMLDIYDVATGSTDTLDLKDLLQFSKELAFLIHSDRISKAFNKNLEVVNAIAKAITTLDRFWKTEMRKLKSYCKKYKVKPLTDARFRRLIQKLTEGKGRYTNVQQQFIFDLTRANAEPKPSRYFYDVWRRLEQKYSVHKMYTTLAKATASNNQGYFPTSYSRRDTREFFAESYAEFCMGGTLHPDVKAVMESI
jgi:hypothetical protein